MVNSTNHETLHYSIVSMFLLPPLPQVQNILLGTLISNILSLCCAPKTGGCV